MAILEGTLKLKGLAEIINKFGYAGFVLIAVAVILHKVLLAGGFAMQEAYWQGTLK